MSNLIQWSDQQQAIFAEMMHPTNPVLLIQATAGAAKSSSLVQATQRYKQVFPDATVRYIVFGSANAEEAKREFGRTAIVSTLHAMAHSFTVKPYSLGKVQPFLTWRDIPKAIKRPFGVDPDIINLIEDYCLSKYLSIDAYITAMEHNDDYIVDRSLVAPTRQVLNCMAQGDMPCTHSFYLKLFHIMVMNGTIQLPSVDRLLVDEFQDMSGLALDLIDAIPATQKIFVGDSNQSIFEFLKLTDGFQFYPDAKVLPLSKSFRVSTQFAPVIQQFLQNNLDPSAIFEGMEYPPNPTIRTRAYLTRNNSSLIGKMIELNKSNTPYHLSHKTKLKQMFKLPLAVVYAKPAFDQKDPELKHLQHEIDDWGSLSHTKREQLPLVKYLMESCKHDSKIVSAIQLVLSFGSKAIIEAYELADQHRMSTCDYTLSTVHASKGLTFDSVELDNDVTKSVTKALSVPANLRTADDRAELCLAFVACTRHRYELINANFLEGIEL